MSSSPIEQFTVRTIGSDIFLGNINISFTNSSLFMGITVSMVMIFFYITLKRTALVPNKLQAISELTYDFVAGIAKENMSEKAKIFFPFVYTLFMFFLFGNLIGIIPYSFAFTSQLIITCAISGFILVLTTIYGIYKNGFRFLKVFIPTGVPLVLLPLMFIIEVLSYFAKGVSMGVRLFANIMAGHIMIDIFAGFIIALGIFGVLPFSFTVILYVFEMLIACLQAYIFTILACIFFDQAVNFH